MSSGKFQRRNVLLGLSKVNARFEIPTSFFFRLVANRSQVLKTHAQRFFSFLLRRMRDLFTDKHMAYGVMAEEEKF